MQSINNFIVSFFHKRPGLFYVIILGPIFCLLFAAVLGTCMSPKVEAMPTEEVYNSQNYSYAVPSFTKNECPVYVPATFDNSKSSLKTITPNITSELDELSNSQAIPDEYLFSLLTLAIPQIIEESEAIVDDGYFHRSLRNLSEEEIHELAAAAFRATETWESNPNRLELAIGALIIGGYESGWRADALGDCWVMNSDGRRACDREERNNSFNYHACGMTQVLASDRMTLFHGYHNRPTCSELQDPQVALNYAATRLHGYYSECGNWCVSGYAGRGERAEAFERRFNRIINSIEVELP
jgi:hypothetical protein